MKYILYRLRQSEPAKWIITLTALSIYFWAVWDSFINNPACR